MNPFPPRLASLISSWRARQRQRGFALVITMALMVLLMVLAVGLLGLSSIELRSSGANSAMAQARANARLALQIAIGELQLQAGPDTRVTATSDIVGGKNRYTGVWNSRALDPKSPGNLYASKSTAFRKWLVSNADVDATKDEDFVKNSVTDPVALVSEKTLGVGTSRDGDQYVYAGKVPVLGQGAKVASGNYAYATMDDAVKARVDLGEVSPLSSDTLAKKTTSLGVGQSPGINRVTGITKSHATSFDLNDPLAAKALGTMVSLNQADLNYGTKAGTFSERFHDLTTDSLGLMVDVTKGGFKNDLNLMAESAIPPAEYSGIGIYNKAFGNIVPKKSDPMWSEALGYARMFNDGSRMAASSSGASTLIASAPNWTAATEASRGTNKTDLVLNTTPPAQPVLLPSIAKVQVVYSFSAHNIWRGSTFPDPNQRITRLGPDHDGYDGSSPPKKLAKPISGYTYFLRLIYTPVVTLHNPYNVPIQFKRLRVSFKNVPFAMQIKVDGVPQYKKLAHNGFVNYNQFLSANNGTGGATYGQDKAFGLNIASGTLQPGEVKMYSINLPGMETWSYGGSSGFNNFQDTGGYGDLTNRKQEFLMGAEGWRGAQYGFMMDQLNGGDNGAFSTDSVGGNTYARNGYIPLKPTSMVSADLAPLPDPAQNTTKFSVEMRLITESEAANPSTPATSPILAAYEFNYNTLTGLQDALLKDQPNKAITTGPFRASSMAAKFDSPMANWSVKTFGIFSAYGKTTHARENGTNEDGAFAAKPWSLNNHTGPIAEYNFATGKPAMQSHEINIQAVNGDIGDAFAVNQNGQSRFVTGQMRATGRISGTFHDVPQGPIQSIRDLNGANLAALAVPPHFAAPLGNSYAHPLLSTSEIISGEMIDHSYLLNGTLYDQYYCSGIQTSGGKSAKQIGADFLSDTTPLTDRRFIPYLADGATKESAVSKLEGNDGYKRSAGYMLMKGPFNVNSTSVEAWKAVLSGMSGKNAMALVAATGAMVKVNELSDPKGARFSRFRLPNSPSAGEADSDAYWQGVIDLDDKNLTRLAEAIVLQVKERGPFLSLGEFVNRQIGPVSDKTLYGALQMAINNTGINSDMPKDGEGNLPGYDIGSGAVSSYGLPTPKALEGASSQGAPGFLTQSDILGVIGNAATVRADTFTIRAYGDSVDSNGKVLAKAYCEVIVQRMPEYCDPTDVATANPPAAASNVQFGRRFAVRSFRWLSPDEV